MHISQLIKKTALAVLLILTTGILEAQNYRDQMILIRLNPGYSMLFGKISDYDGSKLNRAEVSLYDPATLVITETIPVDDMGEYLFTIRKKQTYGLLVTKEGYFPYYHEIQVPEDAADEFEYPIQLPDGIRKDYTLVYPTEGIIPVNSGILEELISLLLNQSGLNLWIPDLENQVGRSRIEFIDSLLTSRGIEEYRLISGSIPGNTDQLVQLNFENDPDAEIIRQYSADSNVLDNKQKWTLQFAASKNKLSDRDLKGLKDFKVYEGNDGFYRYTYGVYNTRQQANEAIQTLKSKGFSQAFPKLIGNLKDL